LMLLQSDFTLPRREGDPSDVEASTPLVAVPDEGLNFEETVRRIELQILEQALRRTGGNKTQAAGMLQLKRTTLSAKLRSLRKSPALPNVSVDLPPTAA